MHIASEDIRKLFEYAENHTVFGKAGDGRCANGDEDFNKLVCVLVQSIVYFCTIV